MTVQPDPDRPVVEPKRPFGAHLKMRWWLPFLLTLVVLASIYLLQLLLIVPAMAVESRLFGKDPGDISLTPLSLLATNAAIILPVPITLLILIKVARVPWRAVLSVGRRFDWRRLGSYLLVFAGLMTLTNIAVHLVNPSPASLFAVTGTTVSLLVIIGLTTPLQAAAEELVFRGVLTASYASWIRSVRPALIVGVLGSSTLFALAHSSSDPWMIINYLGLGASTSVMALISRGLEASIAFHIMNNVFAYSIGALFAAGGGIGQDRSAGAGGPYILLFVLAEAIAVLTVWLIEKRRTEKTP